MEVEKGHEPLVEKKAASKQSPLGEPLDPVDEHEFAWRGKTAQLARLDGQEIYVALKSLCGMLDIKYSAQHERLLKTAALHQHARLIRLQTRGGRQPMVWMRQN
jgi:hypothetical protein